MKSTVTGLLERILGNSIAPKILNSNREIPNHKARKVCSGSSFIYFNILFIYHYSCKMMADENEESL
jgi:hypothetical protein